MLICDQVRDAASISLGARVRNRIFRLRSCDPVAVNVDVVGVVPKVGFRSVGICHWDDGDAYADPATALPANRTVE